MADFACKEAISDPAHQKEEAPHGGMQGFSGSFLGNSDGVGVPITRSE